MCLNILYSCRNELRHSDHDPFDDHKNAPPKLHSPLWISKKKPMSYLIIFLLFQDSSILIIVTSGRQFSFLFMNRLSAVLGFCSLVEYYSVDCINIVFYVFWSYMTLYSLPHSLLTEIYQSCHRHS